MCKGLRSVSASLGLATQCGCGATMPQVDLHILFNVSSHPLATTIEPSSGQTRSALASYSTLLAHKPGQQHSLILQGYGGSNPSVKGGENLNTRLLIQSCGLNSSTRALFHSRRLPDVDQCLRGHAFALQLARHRGRGESAAETRSEANKNWLQQHQHRLKARRQQERKTKTVAMLVGGGVVDSE
ncbi:hypothetical protein IWX49DRAFT_620021 [Phyllosticta citricarpa]